MNKNYKGLACLSKEGVENSKYSKALWNKLSKHFDIELKSTKTPTHCCDGSVWKDEKMIAIFEDKNRYCTLSEMRGKFKNEWMVTARKIWWGVQLSKYMKLPYYCFVYLIPEEIILLWKMTDHEGTLLVPYRTEVSQTQDTIEAKAVKKDTVAKINLKYATIIY